MKQKVGSGESTSSLAKKHGFFWRTIWEHPENAELKNKRKDPNVLHEDDDIFIPKLEIKEVSKGTEAVHEFKRKGEPCKIKIQLFKQGKPRANEDYTIELGSEIIQGKTDGEGKLEHFIPGETSSGKLMLQNGREIHPIQIGYLDPLEKVTGVQQRLNNLGYACSASGELDEATKEALKKFQADNELEATGEIDDAVKSKLKEVSK